MATVTFDPLPANLAEIQERIEGYARDYGLDFYPTIFELIDADQLNAVAAYGGFPTRYPHWRFGMEFEQLNKGYTYGLQKIYELVINNNPCYAYLMRCNGLVDQKLVMAHVYGHCDFFKNNYWFSQTNRKMMDEMANHGNRIRRYMDRFGVEEVETFIDACLSIEDLIDIHSPFVKRFAQPGKYDFERGHDDVETPQAPGRFESKSYMDSFINPPHVLVGRSRPDARTARAAGRLPLRANARRDAIRAGTRAAQSVATRRAVDRSRRSLLLRPAGADQDHERRLGQLLALHDHDPAGPGSGRRGELLRPSFRHAGQLADEAESLQAGHRAVPRHRRAVEQGPLWQGLRRVRRLGPEVATGTPAPAWDGRRSSKCARSTTI